MFILNLASNSHNVLLVEEYILKFMHDKEMPDEKQIHMLSTFTLEGEEEEEEDKDKNNENTRAFHFF